MSTIFITGASSGLGKAAAKLFQSKGWSVIAVMRSPEKDTELSKLPNVDLIKLDVTDLDNINQVVGDLSGTRDIDVVFNNAGYGLGGPFEYASDDQILRQINTNLVGVLRVTRAFIPIFKQNQQGLFITTTSVFGFSSCPLSSVYNATKWALEGFCESIFYELAQFGIGIKTMAAGGIKSNFVNAMDFATGNDYESLNVRMGELVSTGQLFEFNEVDQIAAVVYEAATDGRNQLRYLAGKDAQRTADERLLKGSEGFRIALMEQLNIKSPFQNG